MQQILAGKKTDFFPFFISSILLYPNGFTSSISTSASSSISLINVCSNVSPFSGVPPGINHFPYLFEENELKKFYKDGEILDYKEYLSSLEKHGENGRLHRHAIATIIAKKHLI